MALAMGLDCYPKTAPLLRRLGGGGGQAGIAQICRVPVPTEFFIDPSSPDQSYLHSIYGLSVVGVAKREREREREREMERRTGEGERGREKRQETREGFARALCSQGLTQPRQYSSSSPRVLMLM